MATGYGTLISNKYNGAHWSFEWTSTSTNTPGTT
jgi:hypothetical protein